MARPRGTSVANRGRPRPGAGLGPVERLALARDIARVYELGRRGGDSVVRVVLAWNDRGHPRIALAVGKKIGKANKRNRLRRLYREAFRMEKRSLPSVDLVISPARDALSPTLDLVRASLVRVANEVAARLPRPTAPACRDAGGEARP